MRGTTVVYLDTILSLCNLGWLILYIFYWLLQSHEWLIRNNSCNSFAYILVENVNQIMFVFMSYGNNIICRIITMSVYNAIWGNKSKISTSCVGIIYLFQSLLKPKLILLTLVAIVLAQIYVIVYSVCDFVTLLMILKAFNSKPDFSFARLWLTNCKAKLGQLS